MKDESCVVLSEATRETHHRQFSSLQIQESGCNPHFCLSSGLAQTQRRTSTKIRRCIVNEHYQDTSFKIYRDSEFYDSSRKYKAVAYIASGSLTKDRNQVTLQMGLLRIRM